MELTVAFSTDDGEQLKTDDHAGMAKFFDLYTFTDGSAEFVERRENSKFAGDESMRHGDPEKAKKSLSALEGVDVWASPRFGPNLPRLLKKLVCTVVRVKTIEDGVELVGQHFDEVARQHKAGEERSHVVLQPE
ncbi:MAG: NifB/NifX family molybdenum-iron cluster-binding protein [Armatimonadota bacterium]